MSEKKRGFLGRLFGSKDDQPDELADVASEPEAEITAAPEPVAEADDATFEDTETMVHPVADMSPVPDVLDAGSTPDLAPVPAFQDPAPAQISTDTASEPKRSWFQKLKHGLSRSSSALTDGISSIFTKRKLDATMLEELEDILIQADLGVDTAMAITERLS
ncbi:signal recognition particle receptor subunit alpha, partial [Roseibium sp.]